jgi:thiamine biosynthesis lipoprotein
MGSDAHVIVVGGPAGLIDEAQRRVEELEQLWSRFREDSEISVLNRAAGRPVRVSPETVELVERAIDAWRLSGGAYDPTLLSAVISAGYDRSFEQLDDQARSPAPFDLFGAGADAIEIDGDTIRLPSATGFDPGGIGKGLAADLVADALMASGADGACVNLGGDLRVTGVGPTGGGWTVAIDHPWSPASLASLGLAEGAVATSTTLRRRWRVGGEVRHHLIDPQTGRPAETDANLATVVSAQAWAAEALAKAVVLRGFAHPFDILGGTGAQGLAVSDHGDIVATPGLTAYLGGADLPASLTPALA